MADIVELFSKKETHPRKPVKPGSKKNEPALKRQYKRTTFLNKLASEINSIVRDYGGGLKSNSFYQDLHSRFRKASKDNRYLLLLQLRGMEVNPDYPFSRFEEPQITCEVNKSHIVVNLRVIMHPPPGKYDANFYYFEPILVQWDKTGKRPNVSTQYSDWISLMNGRPEFEFLFPKTPGMQHWLLILRMSLGRDNKAFGFRITEAGKLLEVGTVLKSDLKLANDERKVEQKRLKAEITSEAIRIKAKKIT